MKKLLILAPTILLTTMLYSQDEISIHLNIPNKQILRFNLNVDTNRETFNTLSQKIYTSPQYQRYTSGGFYKIAQYLLPKGNTLAEGYTSYDALSDISLSSVGVRNGSTLLVGTQTLALPSGAPSSVAPPTSVAELIISLTHPNMQILNFNLKVDLSRETFRTLSHKIYTSPEIQRFAMGRRFKINQYLLLTRSGMGQGFTEYNAWTDVLLSSVGVQNGSKLIAEVQLF